MMIFIVYITLRGYLMVTGFALTIHYYWLRHMETLAVIVWEISEHFSQCICHWMS